MANFLAEFPNFVGTGLGRQIWDAIPRSACDFEGRGRLLAACTGRASVNAGGQRRAGVRPISTSPGRVIVVAGVRREPAAVHMQHGLGELRG